MSFVTQGELDQLLADTDGSLEDECVRMSYVAPTRGRKETYADEETLDCGYDPSPSAQQMAQVSGRGQTQEDAIETRARIRLRLEDAELFSQADRVRITKKRGRAIAPAPVFSVVGLPEIGSIRAVLNLERVEL